MGKTLHVQRSAVIPAAPERIFALLDDFRQWEQWSPWEELDPDMAHTYSGPERGVGAVHEWKGNKKAGEGRMEIVDTDPVIASRRWLPYPVTTTSLSVAATATTVKSTVAVPPAVTVTGLSCAPNPMRATRRRCAPTGTPFRK